MRTRGRLIFAGAIATSAAIACVGSDPDPATSPADGGTSSSTSGTASSSGDSGPAVASKCSHDQPFESIEPLTSLNTGGEETTARFSPDELTVYFTSLRSGGQGAHDLYTAGRASLDVPFGQVAALPAGTVNTSGEEYHPTISADGLTLIFERTPDLYVTTRAAALAAFPAAQMVANISGGISRSQPYLLPSGKALYFVYYRLSADSSVLTELNRAAIVGNVVQPPKPVTELNTSLGNALPVVSDDELAFYFTDGPGGTRDGGPSNARMFLSTRAKTEAVWSDPRPVPVLPNVPLHTGKELTDFISADACRLYFHRDGDLYVARRTPPP